MSLGSHATATGVPGNRDRARAATHDARAIFAESGPQREAVFSAESGPQREAVFSADVQRRARKQAQRWRPRDGVGHASVATAARRAAARRCWCWWFESDERHVSPAEARDSSGTTICDGHELPRARIVKRSGVTLRVTRASRARKRIFLRDLKVLCEKEQQQQRMHVFLQLWGAWVGVPWR